MTETFRIEATHDTTVDVSCPRCYAMTRGVKNDLATHPTCVHCDLTAPFELPDPPSVREYAFEGLGHNRDTFMDEFVKALNAKRYTLNDDYTITPKPAPQDPTNEELNREICGLRAVHRGFLMLYTDNEAASAELIDEMGCDAHLYGLADGWRCVCGKSSAVDEFRKRAIAKCWLAWKKAQ